MANIVTGKVEAYIKKLISEAFGSDANEDNRSPNNNHSDGKTTPNMSQNIFNGRFNHNEKEV